MRVLNKKKTSFSITIIVLVIGIGLVAYGVWGLAQRHVKTNDPHPKIETETITRSIDRPAETALDEVCEDYEVEPKYPERLHIPAAGSSGCIERVGLDEIGAIAVPSSIYTAGWYVDSALPGQPGLSIIDGHISGYYNENGIFQNLHKLRAGDEFTVELGSGELLRYKVTSARSVPLKEAAKAMMERDTAIESQLNLITCGGNYDQKKKLYDQRVIITSKLLETTASASQ